MPSGSFILLFVILVVILDVTKEIDAGASRKKKESKIERKKILERTCWW